MLPATVVAGAGHRQPFVSDPGADKSRLRCQRDHGASDRMGLVSAFAIDPITKGRPSYLNQQSTHGPDACYTSIEPEGT